MITARSPLDPHWRARLLEIEDLLLVAHDVEQVRLALQRLVAVILDEWGQRDVPALLELVREAHDLMTRDRVTFDEVRAWTRRAAPWVTAER